MFNFYERVTNTLPTRQISLDQLVQLITSDQQVKQATAYIQAAHAAGIADSFTNLPKAAYQKDKADKLQAILASGTGIARNVEVHNGFIAFDIDEGSTAALANLEAAIKQGKVPFIALAAKSVSKVGFWAAAKAEIPAPEDCPKWLYDRATNGGRNYLQGVHELYHTAIRQLIANDGGGALAGHAGKSLKNARYIAHDPGVYVNDSCQKFTVERLKLALQVIEKQSKQIEKFTYAQGIQADNWQGFCDQFARRAGYLPEPGQLHNYLNSYAIAANLLGISRGAVEQYAAGAGWQVTTNCIDLPYKNYAANYGRWANRIEAAPADKYELKPGQYLSDLLSFDKVRGRYLIAPTGSGKSWLFLNEATNSGRQIIIVAPRKTIVDNFGKDWAKHGILLYMQGTKQHTAEQLQAAKAIVTTYASFAELTGYIGTAAGRFDLVFDEVHSFASDAGIQGRELNACIRRAKEPTTGVTWRSVTITTATPVPFIDPFLCQFEITKVTRPAGSAGQLTIIEVDNTSQGIATRAAGSRAEGRKVLVLYNDKGAGRDKAKAYLEARGHRVAVVSADDKAGTESENSPLNDLTKNGIWPAGIDCIICTTVLNAGVSIYTDQPVDIIIAPGFNSNDIAQFAARIRKQRVYIYAIRKADKDRSGAGNFSASFFYERAKIEAGAALKSLIDQLDGQQLEAAHQHENRALRYLNGLPITNDGQKYGIDYIAIQGAYYSALTEAENYSDRLFSLNLERLGIEFLGVEQLISNVTSTEKEAGTLAATERKAAAELDYLTTLANLQAEAQQAGNSAVEEKLHLWYVRSKRAKPTPAQLLVADRWHALNKHTGNTGLTLLWLADIGCKNSKFKLASAQAAQHTAMHHGTKGASNYSRTAAAALTKLTGGTYTVEQLQQLYKQATADSPELNFSYKELSQKAANRRLLKQLREFFEVSSTRARTDGGGWHELYTLKPLAIDCYFAAPGHQLQDQQQQPKIDLHSILTEVAAGI